MSVYLSYVTQLVRRTHNPKFIFISPPVGPCTFLWRSPRALCTHDNYSTLCVLLGDVTLCKVKADVWFTRGFPMQCRNCLDRMNFVYLCSSIIRDISFLGRNTFSCECITYLLISNIKHSRFISYITEISFRLCCLTIGLRNWEDKLGSTDNYFQMEHISPICRSQGCTLIKIKFPAFFLYS